MVSVNWEAGGEIEELMPWESGSVLSDLWVAPDREWIVTATEDRRGGDDIQVFGPQIDQSIAVPDGAMHIGLSADRTALIYRQVETSKFAAQTMDQSEDPRRITERSYFQGAVSSAGIFVGVTSHGPGEGNQFCIETGTGLNPVADKASQWRAHVTARFAELPVVAMLLLDSGRTG